MTLYNVEIDQINCCVVINATMRAYTNIVLIRVIQLTM